MRNSQGGHRGVSTPIARREFLLLSVAALAITSCGDSSNNDASPRVANTRGGRLSDSVQTVDDLLATTPFRIAHRGSGDNWAEHTLDAYSRSLSSGATAIEVSVHVSSDGVFVCHHDTNIMRMTGVDRDIATMSFRELQRVRVDARSWLGPAAELQPIPALKEVLDLFAEKYVIFIEDKTGTHSQQLLDLMDSYSDSTNHFVWKQTAGSGQFKLAQRRGYRVWGYFVDNANGAFSQYAERFDLVGIYHGASDAVISELVAYGIPVICWEIHTRWMRDRVLKLGVKGLMCSNYMYVSNDRAWAAKDAFSTGLRVPGDLPWILAPKFQPVLLMKEGAVKLEFASTAAYQVGSMSPISHERYTLSIDMQWPAALPDANEHAGISFGVDDDQPYRPTVPGVVGGYHLVLRANGQVLLFRRDPGDDPGDPISSFWSRAAVPAEWVTLRLEVDPKEIRFSRQGDPSWTKNVIDGTYRGGYIAINKNYASPEPVIFRALSVEAA